MSLITFAQESLVDSRFKQLAIDLQGQVDELKHKVVKLEATNDQRTNKDHRKTDRKQKRQVKQGSSLSVCKSSSSLCTYYHPDHPDARPRKSNSYGVVAETSNNEMVQDQSNNVKIGMPTSCQDLLLLGHKLNGFYSVKSSQPNVKGTKMETIYCDFQSDSNGYYLARILLLTFFSIAVLIIILFGLTFRKGAIRK